MQKVILSFFCPALVAIGLRIAFVLFGLSLFGIGHVYELGKDFLGVVEHNIVYFNTFTWDSSWPYWIIFVILTFFFEMSIWDDSTDNRRSSSLYKRTSFFILSFIGMSIIVCFLYSCIGWLAYFIESLTPFTPSVELRYFAVSFVISFPLMMIYSDEKKFWDNFFGGIPGANVLVLMIMWYLVSLNDFPRWILLSYIILYNLTIITLYSYNTAIHLIEKFNKQECRNE